MAAALLLAAPGAAAARTRLPSADYETASRCAVLTEAATLLLDQDSLESIPYFNAMLLWSFAADEAAMKAFGRRKAFAEEEFKARTRAARERLESKDPATVAELDRCYGRLKSLRGQLRGRSKGRRGQAPRPPR